MPSNFRTGTLQPAAAPLPSSPRPDQAAVSMATAASRASGAGSCGNTDDKAGSRGLGRGGGGPGAGRVHTCRPSAPSPSRVRPGLCARSGAVLDRGHCRRKGKRAARVPTGLGGLAGLLPEPGALFPAFQRPVIGFIQRIDRGPLWPPLSLKPEMPC